jgi:hypothetical protein
MNALLIILLFLIIVIIALLQVSKKGGVGMPEEEAAAWEDYINTYSNSFYDNQADPSAPTEVITRDMFINQLLR